MPKHLDRDLTELQRDLLVMAASVEEAVSKAVHALRQRDAALAEEVIAGDDCIDREENQIHHECLRLLALHQPVAGDLRRVTAALGIATDLERIGDLAEDLAGRATALAALPPVPVPARLEALADLVTLMVRQSLESFGSLDTRQARAVCRRDDDVDRLHAELIRELIQTMQEGPDAVEPALSLFSAVRQLERIADHATNIAEGVVYLAEGEVIRHRPDAIRADEPGVPTAPRFSSGPGCLPSILPAT